MTCQRGTCTAPMREDLSFARDAQTYNIPTRRFYCLLGHSIHVNVIPLEQSLPERVTRDSWMRKRCTKCGEWFSGAARFTYCSEDCASQAKREQRHGKRRRKVTRTKPKAASQIRYRPKEKPIPYALPPRNLSMAWT